jgi:hypothetical protein
MCLIQGTPFSFTWDPQSVWDGQAPLPPSLLVQSQEAIGQIALPTARLAFNPTARTLVNLDTWFWAQGLDKQVRQGSSAFGLVAIATPRGLEVTPGDGSAMFPCAWVTSKSDRCSYPYRHSSVGGSARGRDGWPAYKAAIRATWTLRFEQNNRPVTIEGAPAVLRSPDMTAPVEVAEVQTLVTSAG